jgi:hypothetical protein
MLSTAVVFHEEGRVNRSVGTVIGVGLLTLIGCAGRGEVVALNLQAVAPAHALTTQVPADTIVVVADFEDARSDKQRVGARTHRGGGETVFTVPTGNAGAAVARVVTEYLKKRGWRVEPGRPVSGTAPDSGPQVTISGKVVELLVNAASSFGSTRITASSKTLIEATNAEDGSVVRMALNGAGAQTVVWFDPEDAETLLSEALSSSLEQFVTETKFEKKSLRLK